MLEWRSIEYADAGGLPRGRWGHSLTLVDDRYLVVCGGLRAGEVLLDTWIFDLTSRKWSCPIPSGVIPSPRWGHTLTAVGSSPLPSSPLPSLLLLGGREGSKPQPLSSLYALDLARQHWTEVNVGQPAPKPRYGHSAMWLSDASRQMVVFGGHGGRSRYYNDVNILQMHSGAGAVGGSSATMGTGLGLGGEGGGEGLYSSGQASHGHNSNSTSASSSILSALLPSWMKSGTDSEDQGPPSTTNAPQAMWLTPPVTGTPPSKRSGHACARLGNKLFIIGGYDGKDILKDMGVLNLATWSWSTPTITGNSLPPLVGHSAEAVPGSSHIIVFGGSVSATELSCSMYVIDTDIGTATAIHRARAPAARFWHRAVIVSHREKGATTVATRRSAMDDLDDALSAITMETSASRVHGDGRPADVFGCELDSVISSVSGSVNSAGGGQKMPPGLEHMKKSAHGHSVPTAPASEGMVDNAYLLVFGGCGERGQAFNDLSACDVTALARGDDLTETLALASSVLGSDFSGYGPTLALDSGVHLHNTADWPLPTSLSDSDARIEGGLVTHSVRSTSDIYSNASNGEDAASCDAAELKVGLVTKKASAPSMAVGMGGVGKAPSSIVSGSTGSTGTPLAPQMPRSSTAMPTSAAGSGPARRAHAQSHARGPPDGYAMPPYPMPYDSYYRGYYGPPPPRRFPAPYPRAGYPYPPDYPPAYPPEYPPVYPGDYPPGYGDYAPPPSGYPVRRDYYSDVPQYPMPPMRGPAPYYEPYAESYADPYGDARAFRWERPGPYGPPADRYPGEPLPPPPAGTRIAGPTAPAPAPSGGAMESRRDISRMATHWSNPR